MRHSIKDVLRSLLSAGKVAQSGVMDLVLTTSGHSVTDSSLIYKTRIKNKPSRSFFMVSGILFVALIASSVAIGQNVPTASVSATGVIQLPVDQPLNGSYHFDLSQYQFSTDEAMIDFLSTKSTDHFVVRALPHLNKGVLMLSVQDYPSWTVADWNVYLNTATTLNPILPGAPNQNPND